ncbi:uncharacterized protein LOC129719182 [Wyeomyia smithii]|uniref:uncharacterized protein LOC129719182 n=1 Tax=Wyeomyia smithii TaxID=174621 RepID=UPI0024680FB6|nr:uncharacterized protein LOC129719182 [Wyeomyia smithii]XP_055526646.1 uncharacterized protein LOC129719182 [Wyeomyia smithii]XP_055526647.1 uncharacterized protein LOC129719182 [Wyeomyia smithii]XP_055526648.1 uncharacterized protein LOC129719182 [Wyeomyia smithii]XP_055526649.1 uncharacterized protein LOC129719182 [Wyeomyia smithii]XP_055526650.1 uncharacterized protein LOC129719182 [Wyeomyia smithii]XP_055526652.1 uncharacterized protein LOC129719182 [Wyeomyia smithii]XP_055526653.1 unc
MDDEILKTVESMLGTNIQVVDCEKTQTVSEEEVLLVNGVPVTLEGSDGNAIKKALIAGEIPSCDVLNKLLFRAGVLRQPVQLETSLSVKTSTVTTEDITIARNGRILDERSCETKENNYYTSTSNEIWEPVNRLKKRKQPEIIDEHTVDDMLSNQLKSELYLMENESSCRNVPSHPTRQNSMCTESSTSSSAESNYSSRPVSNVSNNSDDNFICQITPEHLRVNNKSRSCTKLSSNKQSISCDSGNAEVTLTTIHSSDKGGSHEYYSLNEISKTNTSNSIQTDSSFGCDLSSSASFQDVPDIAGISRIEYYICPAQQKKHNRTTLRKPQRRELKNNDASSGSSSEVSSLNDDNCLVYRDGNLISGTLETLLKHMVPTDDYYPEQSYLFAFLLSARLFVKPHELLQQVCDICHQQQQLNVYLNNNNNGISNQVPTVVFISESCYYGTR